MHLIVIAMYSENLKEHRYDKVGTTDAVATIHNPATMMVKTPKSHGCHHICPQWTQVPSRIVNRQQSLDVLCATGLLIDSVENQQQQYLNSIFDTFG